ncbi:aspartate--tRNA(Asn) ligase [Candidatus Roizmanbacteria bacterium RIFCSPHIGHO2_12_FULL_33_9]|uniref:Aspartate--tRNA ligase n=1 Tax=Candidatus Roizmanbacteria bacterium RIFCSPHIGHO2_12_FULL_33_9 TaxID=1802045 RepID=A0A1F7HI65_9BACT|nr:MAG: aspartate--tRNA(Asn) ligase [Candidatus Roizmanbacteria bacterium RIFCSPHIGHO2_12_FULL_33_9]
MKKLYIKDVVDKVGKEVELYGWVNNIRDHKKIIFVDLRDRTGIIQLVGDSPLKKLSPEDIIYIKGIVKKRPLNMVNPNIKTGEVEVNVIEMKLISEADELPFDMSKEELSVTLPTLLDYRSLTLRHPKVKSIFRVQESIISEFRNSLKRMDFIEFQSPLLVPALAEGGSAVFPVTYFNYTAYLAQSPQLYKQIMLGVFEKVFTVTHAFRAEPSVTTRHLTEYISLDAEMAFIDTWENLMDTVEIVIKNILGRVFEDCPDEIKLFNVTKPLIPAKIPKLRLKDALEIVGKRLKEDLSDEPDLAPAHEEEICKWARDEKASDFVFITHYPTEKRPFYTHPDPENSDLTLSFDLLGLGIEWVTGGQRINDYKMLVDNIKKWGNKLEDFDIYLQAFKYGMPPEGGFAMGAERITMKLLNLSNIREASLFPRDMERIDIKLNKK